MGEDVVVPVLNLGKSVFGGLFQGVLQSEQGTGATVYTFSPSVNNYCQFN